MRVNAGKMKVLTGRIINDIAKTIVSHGKNYIRTTFNTTIRKQNTDEKIVINLNIWEYWRICNKEIADILLLLSRHLDGIFTLFTVLVFQRFVNKDSCSRKGLSSVIQGYHQVSTKTNKIYHKQQTQNLVYLCL